MEERPENGESGLQKLLSQARQHLQQKKLGQAETLARQARERAPGRPGPTLLLARVAELRNRPEERAELLADFVATHGEDVQVRRQLAEALVELGNFQGAKASARKLIETGKGTFVDYTILGRCHVELGDVEQGRALAEQARRMAPDRPRPVLLLARIAELLDGPEAKAEVLSGFLPDVGDKFFLQLQLADSLMNLGRVDEAVETARAVNTEGCDDRKLFMLAGVFQMCGRNDLAAPCLELMNEGGEFESAAILSRFLRGDIEGPDALSMYQTREIARDSCYVALAARVEGKGAGGGRIVSDVAGGPDASVFERYAEARPYYCDRNTEQETHWPLVTIVAPIHRREDETNLVHQVSRQDYPNLETVIVSNGSQVDAERLRRQLESRFGSQRVAVLELPESASLPEALNAGLDQSTGEYVVRFDADDIYLERYTARTIMMMKRLDADICGRSDIFVWLDSLGCGVVFPMTHHRYRMLEQRGQFVGSGSTLAASRSVVDQIRFNPSLKTGEDRDFYRQAYAAGFKTAVAPPFDHLAVRKADKGNHTWKLGDSRIVRSSRKGFLFCGGSIDDLETCMRRLFQAQFAD